ncbi:MAG: endonuclease III, partial [Patescibacteria group bacterium]
VATILSAQCTDKRVNLVTPALFEAYPTPHAMAKAKLSDLERLIHSTGFYHNKANSIQGAAKKVVQDFGGIVPQTMDELLTLPGVARKTANVVLGTGFHKNEGIVVDTHVKRITGRLGLTTQIAPKKIEQDLIKLFPRPAWTQLSHMLIQHGRTVCKAQKPLCLECPLSALCPSLKTFYPQSHEY